MPVVAAAALLLLGAIVVIVRKSIWLDEAFTMSRTGQSVGETIDHALVAARKPPLYFLMVHFWRMIHPSLESVRLMSAAAALLMVWCLDRASRDLGIGRGLFSVGVLVAMTAHIAWAASEARPYAVALAFLAAAVMLFVRVFVAGSDRPGRDTVLFVLACYGALQTFYYSGFVLAGLFLGGMLLPQRARVVGSGIALAVLMLPWLVIIRGQVETQGSYLPPITLVAGTASETFINTSTWIATTVVDMVHRTVAVYDGARRATAYLGVLIGIVALRLWQCRGRVSRTEATFLVFTVVSVGSLLGLRLLNKTMVDTRHLVIAAIPILLTTSLVASRLRPLALARSAQLVLLAAGIVGFLSFTRNFRGRRDWRGPIQWVMAQEVPGEPVVSFNTNPLSIQYYYRGPNSIELIPTDQGTRKDGGKRMELTDQEVDRLRRFLSNSQGPAHTFWLVEVEGPLVGPQVISEHLDQPIDVLERREYLGARAYHLRLTRSVSAP
ncbi:MAG: hypothetical protein ACKVZ0_05980 [Gemmatimonadales bacterium]